MAGVRKNDILYDLGCGDGRIVVTAAKKFGTRGLGVDIDPQRILESEQNAKEAQVTHLVKFIEGNLFEADFHEATVVTLYLLSSVNLKLRPKLLKELRPGTRIVSHDFDMDDWQPDKSSQIEIDARSHKIFYWVVPANLNGTWEWDLAETKGMTHFSMEIDQKFQNATGVIVAESGELSSLQAKLDGKRFQFAWKRVDKDGQELNMQYEGIVSGDTIAGSVSTSSQSSSKTVKWSAKRKPLTSRPLESL
jgi:SAM-dependent methyltransferase